MGPPRHFFVRDSVFRRRKTRHQAAKKLRFTSKRTLLCEPTQCLSNKARGPFAIIDFVGIPFRCSCDLRLRVIIQLYQNNSPAAFQRVLAIASIRDEIFQSSEEKSTESPFLAIGVRITAGLDQVSEKPCVRSCASSCPYPFLRRKT